MNSPKIVVIGAGSYFFARPVIWLRRRFVAEEERR